MYESEADLAGLAGLAEAAPGHSDYLHRDDEDGAGQAPAARYPRSVKVAGAFALAVVAGWAVMGTMGAGTKNAPDSGAQGVPSAMTSVPEPTDSGAPVPVTGTPSGTSAPTKAKTSATPSRSKTSSSPSKSPSSSPGSSQPSSSASSSPAFTALRMGSTGPAVSAMQQRLQQDGYVLEMLGYSDGTFDRATYNGVTAFQSNHPGTAKADGKGVYGPATDAALRAEVN